MFLVSRIRYLHAAHAASLLFVMEEWNGSMSLSSVRGSVLVLMVRRCSYCVGLMLRMVLTSSTLWTSWRIQAFCGI